MLPIQSLSEASRASLEGVGVVIRVLRNALKHLRNYAKVTHEMRANISAIIASALT